MLYLLYVKQAAFAMNKVIKMQILKLQCFKGIYSLNLSEWFSGNSKYFVLNKNANSIHNDD